MKLTNIFSKRTYLIWIGSILALSAAGAVAYYLIAAGGNKSAGTTTKSDISVTKNEESTKSETTVKTLPSGKTITFPSDEENSNIRWQVEGAKESENLLLSHSGVEGFIASVDQSVITDVCGTKDNAKALLDNISVGILNVSTKQIVHPQNSSCLDLLASDTNKDQATRAKAQAAQQRINEDVKHFTETMTIN